MPGSTYSYNDPGLSTSTTLVNDLAPLWLQDELLAIAQKLTVFQDIGDTPNMPDGEGKTYSAQRYERLPLPGAPLTEGITPDSTALVVNKVTAILEQWGMVVSLTDVGLMTTKHGADGGHGPARQRLGRAPRPRDPKGADGWRRRRLPRWQDVADDARNDRRPDHRFRLRHR